MVKKLKSIKDAESKGALVKILKFYGDKINEVIDEVEKLAVSIAKTNVELTKAINILANMTNNPTLVEDDYRLPGVDDLGDAGTAIESHKKKPKAPKGDNPFA